MEHSANTEDRLCTNIRSALEANSIFKAKLISNSTTNLKAPIRFNRNCDYNKSLSNHVVKLLCIVSVVAWLLVARGEGAYLNTWAVEVKGGLAEADKVAQDHGLANLGQIGTLQDFYLFENKRIRKRSALRSMRGHRELKEDPKVIWWKQQQGMVRVKRVAGKRRFTDPMWGRMWYLNRKGNNMNVMGAWARGYTGTGVVVSVLDDGIEHNHTDLAANYDPKASYDVINDDPDPMPRYSVGQENSHGTRCAGEVAAVANNRKCMVGVAYNASIGGIRMLDQDISDAIEAAAISFRPDYIDIYSSSWGPDDMGTLVNGPDKLAMLAFKKGVTEGRNGKGSIYIWASGNGGSFSDSCGCDGYVNSIYTLSVSGVSEDGGKPWYLEECSSILATAYSSGDNLKERKIVTTDLRNTCGTHTGTSSSAAMASGMCALALQANGNLTWRDMQYIVILTSRTTPFKKPHWVVNGVGRLVSHRFGFGLMDGLAMTMLAEQWLTVPEQHKCFSEYLSLNQTFTSLLKTSISTSGCSNQSNEINHLEHVQVTVWVHYGRRGDLQISLTSPNGTISRLLGRRSRDLEEGSFRNWTFMSVFYWGENPRGEWKLSVKNSANSNFSGTFYGWRLILYGTETDPIAVNDFNYTYTDKSAPEHNYDYVDEYSGDEDEEDEESQLTKLNKTLTSIINDANSNVFFGADNDTSEDELRCHVECKDDSCEGPGNTNCTSCKHFQMDSDGSCVRDCPAGTYANGDTLTCHKCLAPCLECVLIRKYINTFSNSPNNPSELLSTSNNDPPPADNLDPSTNADNLIPVNRNILMLPESIFSNSSDSSYDESSGEADSSEIDISTSFASQAGHAHLELRLMCTACLSSHLLLVRNKQSICVQTCPHGYYPDTSRKQCLACSKGCNECTRVKECLSCKVKYELLGTHCAPACLETEFRNKSHSCVSCHENCFSCSGESERDCVMCAEGRLWEKDLCVTSCSVGFYRVNVANKDPNCEMCDPSCKGCVGALRSQCTSCTPPLSLHKQTCLSQCPTGFYEGNGSVCMPCHPHCVNCKGPNPNDCFECKDRKRLHQGDCVLSCPEGTFRTDTDKVTGRKVRRCDKCHPTCKSCRTESRNQCLTCHRGLLFASGQCVKNCHKKEFRQDDHCFRCHESCSRCDGRSEYSCTDCAIDKFKMGSRCVGRCLPGTYELKNMCIFCPLGCASCDSEKPNSCLRCFEGKMDEYGTCPYTHPECPSNEFYDHSNRACLGCDPSCLKCSGVDANDCISCREDMGLWQSSCHRCCSETATNQCCVCDPPTGLCQKLVGVDDVQWTRYKVTEIPTTEYSEDTTTFVPTTSPVTSPPPTTCSPASFTAAILTSPPKPSQTTSIHQSPTSNVVFLMTSPPPYSNSTYFNVSKATKPLAHPPPQSHTSTVAIVSGIVAVSLIALVLIVAFIISQAKSHHKLCWNNQYYQTVSTTQQHDMSTGRFISNPQTHVKAVHV